MIDISIELSRDPFVLVTPDAYYVYDTGAVNDGGHGMISILQEGRK